MKKTLVAILLLVLAVVSAACGKTAEDSTGAKNEDSSSGQMIKVITTAGGYPFNATNPSTNEIEGFMVDIVKEAAKRANVQTEFVTGEWNSLIPSLQSNKTDVIMDGMYITDERKKEINFTDPVFGFGEGLIVQEGDTKTASLEDLKGKTIGVQMGTSFKDMLEERSPELNLEIKTYQTLADLLKDIQAKRIDAALADKPAFTYMKSKNPNMTYRVVDEYVPTLAGEIGLGVSKENPELLEKLNQAIAEMKEDGTLTEIFENWGVEWDIK
ncbi:substrate-binding periplasmic protein [Domibacillus robiginosus]|uniref:substrate-binding periplasmic protein n=1 Tax=Domibacillus robiginosus TaxID=1071054 RepID=UPI00067B078C|nr:ABC transporter substrate-binding protein [Domibacillus robiginosus]